MEQEKTTKRPLNIDWDKLLGCEDEEPPPDVVIEPPTAAPHPQNHLDMDSDRQHLAREEYQKFSDVELEDKIRRMKSFYETKACKLPDKGQKYIRTLELCEEEREYRKLRRVEKVFLLQIESLPSNRELMLITRFIFSFWENWKNGQLGILGCAVIRISWENFFFLFRHRL